jgi:hypothetical protein
MIKSGGILGGTRKCSVKKPPLLHTFSPRIRVLFASIDVRRLPPFDGGLCGGFTGIGSKLSDLKQSLRFAIRWVHGPPRFNLTDIEPLKFGEFSWQ